MPNSNPRLLVYSHMSANPTFQEDITEVAVDYEHVIRMQGGYWSASFKLYRDAIGPNAYTVWKTNRLWCHFAEELNGVRTWEGYISQIDCDDETGILNVTALGYVHTIQNKYVTASVAGTDHADVWIELIRSTDCEYIQAGRIDANSLHVRTTSDKLCWDEMVKIASLGDPSSHFWTIGVYNQRRLSYYEVSPDPIYFVRNGIKWRVNLNDLYNSVTLVYTDETGAAAADIVYARPASIAIYGTRQKKLNYTLIPVATASALVDTYLGQHAFPHPTALGSSADIQVYDKVGSNVALIPWTIQPGVYRDMSKPPTPTFYLSWLQTTADFVVSEVVARATGVQLRSTDIDEAEILELQMKYQREGMETPHGSYGGGSSGGGGSGGSSGGGTKPRPRAPYVPPKPRTPPGGGPLPL